MFNTFFFLKSSKVQTLLKIFLLTSACLAHHGMKLMWILDFQFRKGTVIAETAPPIQRQISVKEEGFTKLLDRPTNSSDGVISVLLITGGNNQRNITCDRSRHVCVNIRGYMLSTGRGVEWCTQCWKLKGQVRSLCCFSLLSNVLWYDIISPYCLATQTSPEITMSA